MPREDNGPKTDSQRLRRLEYRLGLEEHKRQELKDRLDTSDRVLSELRKTVAELDAPDGGGTDGEPADKDGETDE